VEHLAAAREQLFPAASLPAAVAITALCNVAALTWAVMPLLARALRGWLEG
jgi:antibiotic biosynthesis monooxygenase (ABM) superfamily enzyme